MQPIINMAPTVSAALAHGLTILNSGAALTEESRNGKVLVWNGPVLTHYTTPRARVLTSPKRDANPFFHLFESIWMLAGRNDLSFVAQFNKQMKAYSDDGGVTQPAAYGHRWRNFFGFDQLVEISEELKTNPETRRAVLTMWDGGAAWDTGSDVTGREVYDDMQGDLRHARAGSADVPCNTQCFFTVRGGRLHMAVTCRSNDVLWGAHGANAVHFSILLEYVAALSGYEVGEMSQFSWNYHLYDGVLKSPLEEVIKDLHKFDVYDLLPPTVVVTPETIGVFNGDLPRFCEWAQPFIGLVRDVTPSFADPFFRGVAAPMLRVWDSYKRGGYVQACDDCLEIEAHDWRTASYEWMVRRMNRNLSKETV